MCGIACILSQRQIIDSKILERFTNSVSHRGPDGCGFMLFSRELKLIKEGSPCDIFLGLGHRRLSILDLSDAGAQPMVTRDGAFAVVYNGEIYNHLELRRELETMGEVFRSHCDTEVLLAAYRRWGKDCLTKFNGMWSFVIIDKERRTLFVSRDRLGVKPLYYYSCDGILAFASEIKQFYSLPMFKAKANDNACVGYLLSGYENPPDTFFDNVKAFNPGCFAEISIDDPHMSIERFWFPDRITIAAQDEEEIIPLIRKLFSDSVRYRLRSDVSVGGCLSGGLDSSSIFVEMKRLEPKAQFSAFSACFEDSKIDERSFMRVIIEATGSKHNMVFPRAENVVEDFRTFMLAHDEPVASLSMYAQFCIMKMARKAGVPVLLDGQGGDELFSGYWPAYMLCLNHHLKKGDYWFTARQLMGAISPWGNQRLILEAFSNIREYADRAKGTLPFKIQERFNDSVLAQTWHLDAQKLSPAEYRKAEILKVHLPRLLKWEDRNSMAHSIESRVPFLDFNLVELALSIPPEMNLRDGWNKHILRKSMEINGLPKEICWRKDKKGFETPQASWMRSGPFHGMLLDWAKKREHPVCDYVTADFDEIHTAVVNQTIRPWPLFRLFCLDYWLGLRA